MRIGQLLLAELEAEAPATRRTLERIPEDRPDYAPHPKSMPMGRLAMVTADMPNWAAMTIRQEGLDIAPDPERGDPYVWVSRSKALDHFESGLAEARKAFDGVTDEHLGKPWRLHAGEQTLFTMPRVAVLQTMVLNHLVHHRTQLSLYLRLNDVPVPSYYGPSADER